MTRTIQKSMPDQKSIIQRSLLLIWQYLALIGTATLIIGAFELFFLLTSSELLNAIQLPLPLFIAGTFMSSFTLMTLHILPVLLLANILTHVIPSRFYPQKAYWILIAAAFGLAWQTTLLHGDGIRAYPHFTSIRTALQIAVPAVMVFFTWFCLWNEFIEEKTRKNIMLLAFAAALLFNINILPNYREFHGFLAVLHATILMWILWPLTQQKQPWTRISRITAITILLAFILTLTQWNTVLRNTYRYSFIPAALTTLPFGDIISPPTDTLFQKYLSQPFDPTQKPPVAQELDFQASLDHRTQSIGQHRHGNNVLLIVLESVRWDYWEDPSLTPNFHTWRQNGLYLPNAVAQYPATPLAYGAMFTSQPPSVLALTNYWSSHRLFDVISANFEDIWLTQPTNHWFDRDIITSFFVPPDIDPNRHQNAPDALNYLKQGLTSAPDHSFFAWAHLYDPHAPYELLEEFDPGGRHEIDRAYRSQIAYIDHHLGHFMDWFFQQPFAQNTLVVLVADHGQATGEVIQGRPFIGHQEHVHNLISRIPMFIAGPAIPTQTVNKNLTTTQLDVMPTLFDFLGVPIPFELQPQGSSIYHLLEQPETRTLVTEAFAIRGEDFFDFVGNSSKARDPDSMFRRYHDMNHRTRSYSPKIAIQHGPWKLTYDRFSLQTWLHNVHDDPYQTLDQSSQQPEILKSLLQELELWLFEQSWIITNLHELP